MTLKELFNTEDKFASGCGLAITSLKEDYAAVQLTVEKRHLNAGEICHGGVLFTLADFAFGALLNGRGIFTVTLNSTIQYNNAAHLGDVLTAEARFTCAHWKAPTAEVVVTNQDGLRIASFYGQGYTKESHPLPQIPLE